MKDKVLFTPGPLSTSLEVKKSGLRDLGSRDKEFIELCGIIRKELLFLANLDENDYQVILLQGSGTYGLEAVLSTFTPPNAKWLIVSNGDYGHRLTLIAQILGINFVEVAFPQHQIPDKEVIDSHLLNDPSITHVSLTHCETTTGILNPIEEILKLPSILNKKIFIDAISSFGVYEIYNKNSVIDFLIGSPNKSLEGIPGFSFIFVKKSILNGYNNPPRSFTLDLLAQFRESEESGQFRFTPPVQSIMVLKRALELYFEEGGLEARFNKYQKIQSLIINGMKKMGFKTIVKKENQSVLISSFKIPLLKDFIFEEFYDFLSDHGLVIYPGKIKDFNSFRIGHMGQIKEEDVEKLLENIQLYLEKAKDNNEI